MPLPPINQDFPVPLQTPLPLQWAKWARNGLPPNAVFESELATALNFVAKARARELFSYGCPLDAIPAVSMTARDRWVFAAHTHPLLRRLHVVALMARRGGETAPASSPKATCYITSLDGNTSYGSAEFRFNSSGGTASDTPNEFADYHATISGVPADTDIAARFEDGADGGRLVAACVWEENLPVNASNGYIVPASVSALGPIYSSRREDIFELASTLWKRAAPKLFAWTADSQSSPVTNATSTAKNLLDTSVTTVSTASPGFTVDTTYNRTLSVETVPCKFFVRASMSGGADSGEVWLVDSDGTSIATVSAIDDSTATWYSVDVDLPAASQKLDVQLVNPDATGGTLSVYACGLLQYDE
jgi:hypothetical protein